MPGLSVMPPQAAYLAGPRRMIAPVGLILAVTWALLAACGNAAPAPFRSPAVLSGMRFTMADIERLLLPTHLLPEPMQRTQLAAVPNDAAARYFPDPAAAASAMLRTGRLFGASATYVPTAANAKTQTVRSLETAVTIYDTAESARQALNDPYLWTTMYVFGLDVQEVGATTIGEQMRAFTGRSRTAGLDSAAYVVLSRRANVIQVITVVQDTTLADNGALALRLMRYLILNTPLYPEVTSPRASLP